MVSRVDASMRVCHRARLLLTFDVECSDTKDCDRQVQILLLIAQGEEGQLQR